MQKKGKRTLFESAPSKPAQTVSSPASDSASLLSLRPLDQALTEGKPAVRESADDQSDDDNALDDIRCASAYSSGGDSSPRDLMACDKECGYCGKCPY